MTQVTANPIPFSPLTVSELLERRRDALLSCGYYVEAVFRGDGKFEDFDTATLRARADEAQVFRAAVDARLAEGVSNAPLPASSPACISGASS